MVSKISLHQPHVETFGNPAPLGLLALSVGCAALIPPALGVGLTPAGFKTIAVLVFLFGCLGQLLTGLMEFRNGNGFGGTIFTLFSFQWAKNAWLFHALSEGTVPDHHVLLAVDIVLLVILLPLTFGFGFFSKLLFVFLIDIDLLFIANIIKSLTGTTVLNWPIIGMTVILGGLAIYIALATLINPVAGRQVFRVAGPIFVPPEKRGFDWSLRNTLFTTLYIHWGEHAFEAMELAALKKKLEESGHTRDLVPDLYYLWDFGYLHLEFEGEEGKSAITGVRLNARGIDIHEQLVLNKYDF